MKPKWLKIGITIICVVLFLVLIGYFHHHIFLWDVEKVDLHAYPEQSCGGTVELNAFETVTLVTLYNLSRFDSYITAEPGTDDYRVYIYFKDGTRLPICDGRKDAVIARPTSGKPYYAWNSILTDCIEKWMLKYGFWETN